MKNKTPTYNMTLAQILLGLKRQACREAVATAWELMLGLPVMVLHDKHGFDSKTLDAFVDEVLDLYDSYEKGYLSLQDIQTALKEEAGVVIDAKRGKEYKR